MRRLMVATTLRSDVAEFEEENRSIADALADRGLRPELRPWHTDLEPWLDADMVLIRTTWDYPDHIDEFEAWLDALDGSEISVVNPTPFLRWNIRKRYLLELQDAGVAIVPVELVAAGETVEPADTRRVLKPEIGVGGIGARVIEAGETVTAEVDSVLNPFMDSVADGERSVFVVEGRPVAVFRKRPAEGEFRVHVEYGGSYEIDDDSDPAVVEAAHAAYEAADRVGAGGELTYLRVDLLRGDDGLWLVLEVEGVEPSLYAEISPVVAEALGRAVSRLLPEN